MALDVVVVVAVAIAVAVVFLCFDVDFNCCVAAVLPLVLVFAISIPIADSWCCSLWLRCFVIVIALNMHFQFGNTLSSEFFMFGNVLLLGFFKFGNIWFEKRERENHGGICLAFISLSSGMGSIISTNQTNSSSRGGVAMVCSLPPQRGGLRPRTFIIIITF